MTTVAIIQARTGSSRLPGKILKTLGNHSVIRHVYDRVCQTRHLDAVVVAMPEGPMDDALADHVSQFCTTTFRGSETDVLARYFGASQAYPSDTIVRVTSDCPFFDPDILSDMLQAFDTDRPDYMTNTLDPHLPRGLDAEVFTSDALALAAAKATASYMREHVTPFIYQNPDQFVVTGFRTSRDDWSDLRWTLDTPDDWELIKSIHALLPMPFQQARLRDFLALYDTHPELRAINAAITQKPLEAQ